MATANANVLFWETLLSVSQNCDFRLLGPLTNPLMFTFMVREFMFTFKKGNVKAPGIHESCCHISLPWLAQGKPGLVHSACTGQAKARIDGARSRVYLVPNKNFLTINVNINGLVTGLY